MQCLPTGMIISQRPIGVLGRKTYGRVAVDKENPGQMPNLKKIKIKGVEQWDDSDMMEFLEAYVKEHITPQLGGAVSNAQEDEDVPF